MKKIQLLLILIFVFNTTFSQENSEIKNVKLKIYLKGSYDEISETNEYENNGYIDYVTISNKNFDFGRISFAIELNQNKKLRHEIVLSDFLLKSKDEKTTLKSSNTEITNITSGEKITTLGVSVRYQINYYFLDSKIVNPFVGGSSKIYLQYAENQPATSVSFPYSRTDIYLPLDIIFGAEFKITERLSLNTDIPFTFYQFWYEKENIENPQLSDKYQETNTFNGESFPKQYCFRIGASYRL